MSTVFVTGAGTDIGKTFVCCRLIQALPPGLRLRAIKPVVTGFPAWVETEADAATSAVAASDPARLLLAQGLAPTPEAIAATSPWRFRAPLSADMAATREHRAIPFDALVDFSRAPAGIGLNLVEGIGGVMAPLDDSRTVLDWIAALDVPTLLVVGSYLGSLSHALTATAALASRGIETLAVVISASADEPVPTKETAATLARFLKPTPVIRLPRDANASAAELAALVLNRIGGT